MSVGTIGPCTPVLDVRSVAGQRDAETWAVLELVVPEAFESGGEEVAGSGQEIKIEERVAEGSGAGELVGEAAIGKDLGTKRDRLEVMAQLGESSVVRGDASIGRTLQKPGAADMIFAVAGEAAEAGGGEPFEERGEPGLDGGEISRKQSFRAREERKALRDLGECRGVGDAIGVAAGSRTDCSEVERRFHATERSDEPGLEVPGGVLRVRRGACGVRGEGDEPGSGERGNGEGELE